MDNTPLVSVCMITYKQEAYIGKAIESVLMQQTDFPIELVIGEDASPDGTLRICQHYQALHPDKIRLMTGEKNMGFSWNFARTLWATRGEYIALLEGDDYWTDPLKLQKQVDFLRKSPDFNLHFHNAHLLKQG
ncbi:MAG TPA: glycosyltransferase, partial [Saprospiraceae bacterium]|nr:glycosyltransferase [Saprospiraceae bacterium]